MKEVVVSIIAAMALCGCTTPKVETTQQWEGHYMDTNSFTQATSSIDLEKGESIWVLSNSTLKRLLKNVGK